MLQDISITDIENICIGSAEDTAAGTGCTVIICPQGAPTGVDVRGGGPASRETELLNPVAAARMIHAVLLSGGSAYGLDAAGGVMQYLEEHGIGFQTRYAKVPLVCASCIYDLGVGAATIRPDAAMGYAACVASETNSFNEGNHGAGTGATVGKLRGKNGMMKSGLGTYAVALGKLKLGAVAVVNALGDVYENGRIIAGMLTESKNEFARTVDVMYQLSEAEHDLWNRENTTLAAVITNACFDKAAMNKIAAMAQNGIARSIAPVHTTADGDTVYAMSCGDIQADVNVVGTLAAEVVQHAVLRAVHCAAPAYGLKAACSFIQA